MSLGKTRLLLDACEKVLKEDEKTERKKKEEEAISPSSIKRHPFIVFHGPLRIMLETPTSRDSRIRCVDSIRRGGKREEGGSPLAAHGEIQDGMTKEVGNTTERYPCPSGGVVFDGPFLPALLSREMDQRERG